MMTWFTEKLLLVKHAHASVLSLPNYSKFDTWQGLVWGIIEYLLSFAGLLAVVAVVYSGIIYITAGSDSGKAGTAKKNMTWAITGVVLILLSIIIINTVQDILHGKIK